MFCVSDEIGSVRLPIHAICIDWWIPLLLKSVSMIGCGDFGWEGWLERKDEPLIKIIPFRELGGRLRFTKSIRHGKRGFKTVVLGTAINIFLFRGAVVGNVLCVLIHTTR